MPSFQVIPLGCKVSHYEAGAMASFLKNRLGLIEASHADESDVVLLQTCTVTERADLEVRKLIRHHRRRGPVRIIVTGCYATRNPEALYTEGADLVLGHDTHDKMSRIANFLGMPKLLNSCEGDWEDTRFPLPTLDHKRVYLKIHDGCDVACTFCIIPIVRGSGRSLPPWEVKRRIQVLVDNEGVHEIILTGVNLSHYGSDLGLDRGLLSLCRDIVKMPGDFRIRISSLGAFDQGPELIKFLCEHPRFAPHLHIPLQSASPAILQDMRRPYTLEKFEAVIRIIAERYPNVCLGTDIIAGFPTEREEDFEYTLRYLTTSRFDYLHVFPYSSRPGTPADQLGFNQSRDVILQRARRLRDLSRTLRERFYDRVVGTRERALTLYRENETTVRAITGNYIEMAIEDKGALQPNSWIDGILTRHPDGSMTLRAQNQP